MVAGGIEHLVIAGAIGCDPKTLRKYYRQEIDHGGDLANGKVVANLFRIACGEGREAVTAAIWWTKSRMGWSEYAPPPPPKPKAPAPEATDAKPAPKSLGKKLAAEIAGQEPPPEGWGDVLKH